MSKEVARKKPCRRCTGEMETVYNADKRRFIMWWCPQCNATDKAIGREKLLELEK